MPRPSVSDALRRSAGRPRLLINRRALLANVRTLRQTAGGAMRYCAVVKANAYGHGAAGVVDVLTSFYTDSQPAPAVDAFAVATIAEADALPDVEVPVYVFRPVEGVYLGENRLELEQALRRGFTLSLISTAAADDVARAAERLNVRASVQVMIDTGMTREGCEPAKFSKVVDAILARPALRLSAVGTHFTDGEHEDEPYNDEQLRLFHECVDPVLAKLPEGVRTGLIKHVANSGGSFFAPDDTLDMIRPGISTYGIDPTGRPGTARPLRPVAKWTAPLLSVREVPAGTCVGYNRAWRAAKATRVGLIPAGYADGYPRMLSNRAVVRVPSADAAGYEAGNPLHDAFCPVIGRVSMDYVTVDLAAAPWAQPGDDVVLLDDDPLSPCSAYALAEQAGTIPYELLCGIGSRIVRVGVDPTDAEMGGGS